MVCQCQIRSKILSTWNDCSCLVDCCLLEFRCCFVAVLESLSWSPMRLCHQAPWSSSSLIIAAIFSLKSVLHCNATGQPWQFFDYVLSRCQRASAQKLAKVRRVDQKLFNSFGRHGGSIGHQKQKPIGMLRIEFTTTYICR